MPNVRFIMSREVDGTGGTPVTARFVSEKLSGKTIVSAGYTGTDPDVATFDFTIADGTQIIFRGDPSGPFVVFRPPGSGR